MNKELTTQLLSMYRDIEERESMRYFMPMEWNGKKWCSATEGHHFIMIPENEENKLEKPPCDKPVNIAGVIPEFNCIKRIDIEKLKSAYDSIKLVNEEITHECSTCDGVGRFEHDGHDYDCQSCDETGEIGTGRFHDIKNPNATFKIDDAIFTPRFIKTLIDTIQLTNCQRLEIRYSKQPGITVFELGNQIITAIASKSELETENEDELVAIESETEEQINVQ